jgi:hypothetical protein
MTVMSVKEVDNSLSVALEDVAIDSQPQERQVPVWKAALIFKEILGNIEGIEGILGEQGTDGPSLSVIVNRASKECCREIYDCEMQLMQRLDTGFDFRLIDRRDRPLCDVLNVELYDIYLRM